MASRQLMRDNAVLLAELAQLQRGNRQLGHQLAEAAAHIRGLGGCGSTQCRSQDAEDGQGSKAVAAIAAATGAPPPTRIDVLLGGSQRSAGGASNGRLLPGCTGRVLHAALEVQQRQLADASAALAATLHLVDEQFLHIQRLTKDAQKCDGAHDDPPPGGNPPPGSRRCYSSSMTKTMQPAAGSVSLARSSFALGLAQAYQLSDEVATAMVGARVNALMLAQESQEESAAPSSAMPWLRHRRQDRNDTRPEHCSSVLRLAARPGTAGVARCCTPATGSLMDRECDASHTTQLGNSYIMDRAASTGRLRPTSAHAGGAGLSAKPASTGKSLPLAPRGVCSSASRHVPPAHARSRPTTAGGMGMMACLRADLQAWRAK